MPHYSVNIIPQDQIDDGPILFTTPIPPLRNKAILTTPAISVSTTPYSSQYFLTMNSPMLSSMLTALETKTCDTMMVITFYFKACVRYFFSNFYFSPNDRPSETMKNDFYFI